MLLTSTSPSALQTNRASSWADNNFMHYLWPFIGGLVANEHDFMVELSDIWYRAVCYAEPKPKRNNKLHKSHLSFACTKRQSRIDIIDKLISLTVVYLSSFFFSVQGIYIRNDLNDWIRTATFVNVCIHVNWPCKMQSNQLNFHRNSALVVTNNAIKFLLSAVNCVALFNLLHLMVIQCLSHLCV